MKFFVGAFKVMLAILLGLGFLAVYTISDATYRKQEYTKLGQEALDEGNIEFFMNSYFYNKTPYLHDTFTQNQRTYELYIYEVAGYVNKDNNIITKRAMNIIVRQLDGQPIDSRMIFKVHQKNVEEPTSFLLIRMGDLPVYVVRTADGSYIGNIELDWFYKDNVYQEIEKFEIAFEHIGGSTVMYDVEINPDEFHFAELLQAYYDEHDDAPKEETLVIGISDGVVIGTNPLVWLWSSIYIVTVFGGYFGLRMYKKYKKMGRKELSPGLEKDVEMINTTPLDKKKK
jgi:hypothetical protein